LDTYFPIGIKFGVKWSARNAVEYLLDLFKWAQWRPHSSNGRKWIAFTRVPWKRTTFWK